MADARMLRAAGMKVFYLVLVVGIGHWLLWPELPVREWFEESSDWKMKFAFIGWVAVSIGMSYDALLAVYKAMVANPGARR